MDLCFKTHHILCFDALDGALRFCTEKNRFSKSGVKRAQFWFEKRKKTLFFNRNVEINKLARCLR